VIKEPQYGGGQGLSMGWSVIGKKYYNDYQFKTDEVSGPTRAQRRDENCLHNINLKT
jgi:hypothetical protein